jgi:hypothetical protein
MKTPQVGDYVLATKYNDGDLNDHWCVGFLRAVMDYDPFRYDVVDGSGQPFRGNGFRRIKCISAERGAWILANAKDIERSTRSLWFWVRYPMKERA